MEINQPSPMKIMMIMFVLPNHWSESCSKPLGLWISIQGVRMGLLLAVYWVMYFALRRANTQDEERALLATRPMKIVNSAKNILEMFNFAWFILGNLWILGSSTGCAEAAPGTYGLALGLLVASYVMLLLPCILFMLFLPILCFCFPCIIRLMGRMAMHDPMRGQGATQQAIDEMPSITYREGTYDAADAKCIICLSDYEEGDALRVLKCAGSHHFHKGCLDDWLRINATCPSCREVVVDAGGLQASRQASSSAGARAGRNASSAGSHIGGPRIGGMLVGASQPMRDRDPTTLDDMV